MRNLLVTGGAGFIGSNFTRYMLEKYPDVTVVVYDKLTYAGNVANLRDVAKRFGGRFSFVHGDICVERRVLRAVQDFEVDTIVNFAAETHVDRSISGPMEFARTDIRGTLVLLEAAREFDLRFHQVSTDEVYGDISKGRRAKETDILNPSSPYAASKAGADMLVNAYCVTHGVSTTITRGANCIGPYQHPEKVVPLFITNAIDSQLLPLYGDGRQQRDYQYVLDHCEAIGRVLRRGEAGEIYNVGTEVETSNIQMARMILNQLGRPLNLIYHVEDRPGHDRRYALDISKLRALGWSPSHTFAEALLKTIQWYLDNEGWWRKIKLGEYWQEWHQKHYASRPAYTKVCM